MLWRKLGSSKPSALCPCIQSVTMEMIGVDRLFVLYFMDSFSEILVDNFKIALPKRRRRNSLVGWDYS